VFVEITISIAVPPTTLHCGTLGIVLFKLGWDGRYRSAGGCGK